MPRLTITINGQSVPVYHKNDVWRGGMVAFGRAERSVDDHGGRRLVKTAEVSGYHQSEYLLEDQTLVGTWYDLKPEPIAEIVGPEPSFAWARGAVTTSAGNKHQLEYKLSPHTKEQAEKVFRERLIAQAGRQHSTPAEVTDQPRELKPTPEHVFRRRGDFWQIVFEGRELPPIRHVTGMTYIRALLARPGRTFAALDLYEMENPPPPEAVSPSKGVALDWEDRDQHGAGGSHPPLWTQRCARRSMKGSTNSKR